jgi:hypothetical protein
MIWPLCQPRFWRRCFKYESKQAIMSMNYLAKAPICVCNWWDKCFLNLFNVIYITISVEANTVTCSTMIKTKWQCQPQFKCALCSEAFGPYFHSDLLEFHFMSKCNVFSSIWWSIVIKLYLNFMLRSIFWWKNITFWQKKEIERIFWSTRSIFSL